VPPRAFDRSSGHSPCSPIVRGAGGGRPWDRLAHRRRVAGRPALPSEHLAGPPAPSLFRRWSIEGRGLSGLAGANRVRRRRRAVGARLPEHDRAGGRVDRCGLERRPRWCAGVVSFEFIRGRSPTCATGKGRSATPTGCPGLPTTFRRRFARSHSSPTKSLEGGQLHDPCHRLTR